MGEGRPARRGLSQRRTERRITSLAALKRELEASGAYDDIVLRGLEFGNVWWIPDEFTNIGFREGHPWVVVVPYRAGRAFIEACLRTTKDVHSYGIAGLVTPPQVVTGLNDGRMHRLVRTPEVLSSRLCGLPPHRQVAGYVVPAAAAADRRVG